MSLTLRPVVPEPPAAPRAFRPLSEYRCRQCQGATGAEGTIYALLGAEPRVYCGPPCARAARVWPWSEMAAA